MDFTKLLVHLDNRLRLLFVGLETSHDNFFGIVRSTASLCALEAASNANFEGCVKVKDRLGLSDDLFKVNCLVFGSWETVNQVVLKSETVI